MAKPKVLEEDNTKNLGLKVEGDLGDLQIIPSSDSDDDDNTANSKAICAKKVDTLANFPSNLIHTSSAPLAGNVAISNSDNIQFGNNTHFHGPVTIKQIINKTGLENASYARSDEENVQPEEFKPTKKCEVSTAKKIRIRPWLKITISATTVIIIGIVLTLTLVIHDKKTQKDRSSDSESEPAPESNYSTVMAICYENITHIIFSVILVPLTVLLVIYPLLTTQLSDFDTDTKTYLPNSTIPDTTLNVPNRLSKDVPKADGLLIAPNHLRIVSRSDWLAQPVENELDKIRQPVPWVIISHTATESCQSQSECVLRVRLIQMFHIESRNWDDIGYNFLVAGDGSAYFGRGWDYIGAHTLGYNKYSIGISFIGTFNNEPPPQKQIEACQKLITLGVQLGKLSKDYKLFAHRQLSSTKSPGDKLYDIVKTWPHFVNDSTNILELMPKY